MMSTTDPASRVQRVCDTSGADAWTLYRLTPDVRLRPFVRDIEGYSETGGRPVVRKQLPGPVLPLIIVLDHGFSEHSPGGAVIRPLTRSFIAGLQTRPAIIGSRGRAECLQVNFTPPGAWRLLNIDMSQLSRRVVFLDELPGIRARELEDRLARAPTWMDRLHELERVLLQRLTNARPLHPAVDHAVRLLTHAGGDLTIASLTESLGCSRKLLASRFKLHVGVSPKTYARVLRFDRAREALEHPRQPALAEIAAHCGYADQPHLTREFSRFAGESPASLRAKPHPDGMGLPLPPR